MPTTYEPAKTIAHDEYKMLRSGKFQKLFIEMLINYRDETKSEGKEPLIDDAGIKEFSRFLYNFSRKNRKLWYEAAPNFRPLK